VVFHERLFNRSWTI